MSPGELRNYVREMEVEVEKIEEFVFDIALYSDGSISVGDFSAMQMKKIKKFEKRLSEKIKNKSGKKGTEYL